MEITRKVINDYLTEYSLIVNNQVVAINERFITLNTLNIKNTKMYNEIDPNTRSKFETQPNKL